LRTGSFKSADKKDITRFPRTAIQQWLGAARLDIVGSQYSENGRYPIPLDVAKDVTDNVLDVVYFHLDP